MFLNIHRVVQNILYSFHLNLHLLYRLTHGDHFVHRLCKCCEKSRESKEGPRCELTVYDQFYT